MAFTFALTGEGPTDRVLLPLLNWTLARHARVPFSGRWAEPSVFADRSKDVRTRVVQTATYYTSDVIFVHRDADRVGLQGRIDEIEGAVRDLVGAFAVICVVPVRMTEAWLLFDEAAIRRAADNPNGQADLSLPSARQAQRLADPKRKLNTVLVEASETAGRRRHTFERTLSRRVALVAENIADFAPLHAHTSFQAFDAAVRDILLQRGWA